MKGIHMKNKYFLLLCISFNAYSMETQKNDLLKKQLHFNELVSEFNRIDNKLWQEKNYGLINNQILQVTHIRQLLERANELKSLANLSIYSANILSVIANNIAYQSTNHNQPSRRHTAAVQKFSSIRDFVLKFTVEPRKFNFQENYALNLFSIKVHLMLELLQKNPITQTITEDINIFFTTYNQLQSMMKKRFHKKREKNW